MSLAEVFALALILWGLIIFLFMPVVSLALFAAALLLSIMAKASRKRGERS